MQAARGHPRPPGTNLLSPTVAARSVVGSTVVHIIPRIWGTIKSFCQAYSSHSSAVNGSSNGSGECAKRAKNLRISFCPPEGKHGIMNVDKPQYLVAGVTLSALLT
jgi:hypothetical protein